MIVSETLGHKEVIFGHPCPKSVDIPAFWLPQFNTTVNVIHIISIRDCQVEYFIICDFYGSDTVVHYIVGDWKLGCSQSDELQSTVFFILVRIEDLVLCYACLFKILRYTLQGCSDMF